MYSFSSSLLLLFCDHCCIYIESCEMNLSVVHGKIKLPNHSPLAIELNPSCSGKAQSSKSGSAYGMKTQSLDVLLEYFLFHLLFVHCEARMLSPVRLFNKFRSAGKNERLDQWFSTGVPRNPRVPPVQSRGSASLQFRAGFK